MPGSGGTNTIPNDDAEYYATYSTDGGVTWAANQRLSGGFSNSNASGNGIDFGDYVGQNAYGGKFTAVWADNSNCDGTNLDGTLHAFDLYTNTLMLPSSPTANSVVSRKTHGGAGTFDIPLPLTGTPGIECRSGGATNDYQIVFAFPSAVTFTGATVAAGTGSVGNTSGSGTTTATVNLTGVGNAQIITVILQNASSGTVTGNINVPMGVLVGDTNGDRCCQCGRLATQTRSRSGQTTDGDKLPLRRERGRHRSIAAIPPPCARARAQVSRKV